MAKKSAKSRSSEETISATTTASGQPPKKKSRQAVASRKAAPRKAVSARKISSKDSGLSLEERRELGKSVISGLAKLYPRAVCALKHESPFQLLVATILSAQCTDERVNLTTPALFRKYPDAYALAKGTQEDVESIIKSLGFFRNKATNIRGMAQGLVERFDGQVPQTLAEIITLPGVGRKTGNVVLGTCFGISSGVVVDTHVTRITNLLGLTTSKNAEIIEREMMELIPRKEWINFSHRLVYHGRQVCIARRPKCTTCSLLSVCQRNGLKPLVEEN